MKKYTIKEIQKFLIWVEKEYPQITLQNAIFMVTEDKLNEANGYTPDTHVESENKFVNQQVPIGPNIGFIDSQYTEELMKDGPDPDNDSIY